MSVKFPKTLALMIIRLMIIITTQKKNITTAIKINLLNHISNRDTIKICMFKCRGKIFTRELIFTTYHKKKSHNVYVNKACECIGCHRKLWVEEAIIIFISTWIPVLQISSSKKTDSLNLHTIHQLYMCPG